MNRDSFLFILLKNLGLSIILPCLALAETWLAAEIKHYQVLDGSFEEAIIELSNVITKETGVATSFSYKVVGPVVEIKDAKVPDRFHKFSNELIGRFARRMQNEAQVDDALSSLKINLSMHRSRVDEILHRIANYYVLDEVVIDEDSIVFTHGYTIYVTPIEVSRELRSIIDRKDVNMHLPFARNDLLSIPGENMILVVSENPLTKQQLKEIEHIERNLKEAREAK